MPKGITSVKTENSQKNKEKIMKHKARQLPKRNLDNLPTNPNYCMIVPDADDLWDDTEGNVVSTGMS